MKVLWIVNMILPELAERLGVQTSSSGSWMEDLSRKISEAEDVELAIAAVGGREFQDIPIGNIRYFLLPGNGRTMLFYTSKLRGHWKRIYETFRPDLVHLHGTEYSHGLSFLRNYPDLKAVVSIQGVLKRIKDVALEGVPAIALLCCRTWKENLRLNGMIENAILLKINARREREILNRVQYANIVNYWDMSVVKSMNCELKTFQIDYNLRESFYKSPKWNIRKIERFTILTNPGTVPLKGLHILLKALRVIKRQYPQVKLTIPGMDRNGNGKLRIVSGYHKYIDYLLEKLEVYENVQFAGRLTGEQMVEKMVKSHMVVIPSAIEGTSLMLRESMFLGVPAIASFRGGMADFIDDKVSGYLYDFPEYSYLAHRVTDLFGDDALAVKVSQNAIRQAEIAHEREKNPRKYLNMYKQIIGKK